VYQPESSAFDSKNHTLYTQVSSLSNDGNYLLAFDTATKTDREPVRMGELCSNMEVAYVGGDMYLLCVRFVTNDVVKVDVVTGKTTTMLILPPLHDPVGTASTVRSAPDGSSASYFLQLQGTVEFRWVEIDVASHRIVSNSSVLIYGNIRLAMTVYV
jgi:hypothetical protein